MGIFSKAKDRITERAALLLINSKWLAPFGEVTCLRIDSTAKTLHADLELKGETAPIHVEVIGYAVHRENDRYFALAKEIRTSREWLTTLANAQAQNRRFEVPPQVGRWLLLAL